MPVAFNGTSTRLEWDGQLVSAFPFSIFGWVKLTAAGRAKYQVVAGLADFNALHLARAYIDGATDDKLTAQINNGSGGSALAASTNTIAAADTWYPFMVTWVDSSTSRSRLGSAPAVTGSGRTLTFGNFDKFGIGVSIASSVRDHFLAGEVAEITVWSADISDTDYTTLRGDVQPETIQPGSLIEHWSLLDASTMAGTVSRTLTATDATTGGTHPITREAPADPVITSAYTDYTVTGQNSVLAYSRLFTAADTTYSITGQDVSLVFEQPGVLSIVAASGSYTIIGSEALGAFVFNTEANSYTVSGQDVSFTLGVPAEFTITADSTTYQYNTKSVNLIWSNAPPTKNGKSQISIAVKMGL